MGRYEEYRQWQDKILGIGSVLRKRRNFISERDRKLYEELSEVALRAHKYLEIDPGRREHHQKERQDAIEEMYDFMNIVSIVLGVVNEPVPAHLMLQRLLMYHPRYGTEPRVGSVCASEKAYKTEEIFGMWEEELCQINEDIKKKIAKGSYSMEDRFAVANKNLLGCVRETEKSVSALPTRYREFKRKVKEKRIVYPLFDLKLAAGDSINNAAIGMGIFGQVLPPYAEMHDKLVLRDKRYRTG